MEIEKLLPCPFCWGSASLETGVTADIGGEEVHYVTCMECSAQADPHDWQTRPDHPSPAASLEGEVARLKADRNLFAGKYRSIVALMDSTRQKVQEIVDHIEDESDRAYLGSTNHADWLRDLVEDMDGWSFDAMLPKGDINKMVRDPYAEIRQQRARADKAEAALAATKIGEPK